MKQSNKVKTPLVFRLGLVLLCTMMISASMMGDLYARYTTTVMGSATAKVAKIDCAVNYEFSGYGNIGDIDGDGQLVYAVIEDFSVENTGEVSFIYDLKLKLSKDVSSATYDNPVDPPTGITLYAPKNVSNVTYVYHPSDGSSNGATTSQNASGLTGGAFNTFTANKVYYAYSSNGTDFTWDTAAMSNEEMVVPSQTLMLGQKYYYKIIYFIAPAPGVDLIQQQMTLLYNITCTQID